jgi:hypothetical protein
MLGYSRDELATQVFRALTCGVLALPLTTVYCNAQESTVDPTFAVRIDKVIEGVGKFQDGGEASALFSLTAAADGEVESISHYILSSDELDSYRASGVKPTDPPKCYCEKKGLQVFICLDPPGCVRDGGKRLDSIILLVPKASSPLGGSFPTIDVDVWSFPESAGTGPGLSVRDYPFVTQEDWGSVISEISKD